MIALAWVLFLALILVGVPVAFVLGGSSVMMLLIDGTNTNISIAQKIVNGLDSFTLLAIPFFMVAGNLMNETKVGDKIFDFAHKLVCHLPGGLAQVNIVTSMVMAGMSGTAVNDISSVGPIEVRAMEKVGFDRPFAGAITAASSAVGPIIPPSVPLVLIGNFDVDDAGENQLDMVVHNDRERAMISTRHLLDLGHRRIACVTGPAHSKFSADQKAGFLDAMLEYGMRPAENDFFDTAALQYDNGIKVGYEIFCRRNRPTAIFAGNDYVAFGIIDTAKKLGLSVPEEFSIIGCGGMMPGDSPRTPILTTTRSLPEETARFAVEKLLRQIHEPGCPNSTTVIRVDTICYGETTRIYRQEPASGAIPVDSDRLIAVP